uniref:ZZ-type domain-containing protein n=1 Tax=Acrobeloides nanus TaxID=290746 RepID=A0A914CMQ9_9BILA
MIHKDIMCNRCEMEEIAGNRYKCLLCDRYNMCQRCYSKEDHPHQECFLRLAYPLPQEEIQHLVETVQSVPSNKPSSSNPSQATSNPNNVRQQKTGIVDEHT